MTVLSEVVAKLEAFVEKAARPGVLGLAGRRVEKRCQKDLALYFQALGKDIVALKLEERATQNETHAREMVGMALHNVLRKQAPVLLSILEVNLEDAYVAATKLDYSKQADDFKLQSQDSLTDRVGESAIKAADWAAEHAAELVTGINTTTQGLIQDAVASGIENQASVGGIARLIRDAIDGMTKSRSLMIASTEVNDAMSFAALEKMTRIGIEYKQIILSDDACPICEENASEDPVPLDHVYSSGDDSPPFHPNCRCAITGARPPDAE